MCESFPQVKLGDLFEISKGSICPFLFPNEEFAHHSLPAFDASRGPAIEFGREIESNKTLLSEPVVLLSKLNPRTSRVSVVDPSNSYRRHCCSTEFIAYKAKQKAVSLNYYRYWFETDFFRRRLQNSAVGTTNSHVRVNPGETLNWKVPYPDIQEQNKIAEILSTVDQAIDQTQALIAKQKRIKTGLMQDLLTRGIDEHGNVRSELTHQFKDSPLGRIPVDWNVVELDTVVEFVTSGSRGWAQFYSVEGATFLRIGNLTREHINLRLDNLVRVSLPKSSEGKRTSIAAGDILISITADLGIIGVIPKQFGEGYVNQHIALVRLLPSKVDARFVGWYLSGRGGQSQFEKLNESGAKAGLNLPTIRKLLIPIANPSEQVKISEILDSIIKRIENLYSELHKLNSLKSALMQDLLTGKKPVAPLLDSEVMV
ncbi:restriction endonuclease subunit S [Paenibacillus sp. HJGM_3]|uniref:restriction endonuclease subunit S n=1 Tax=Paenibacillus sp. HJGM_3 TaxID=3379816 RepID=UPI00385EC261